jgi:hypothetical protein
MGDVKRKSLANAGGEKKRQRVSRACDQCRAAREKCDGIQPMCFTCVSSNRACSYTANPKKRGIQPGYIRTLELALATLLVNVPGSEEFLKTTLQDEKGQALLSGADTDGSNKLHRKWRRNAVCKAIDGLLSGAGAEEALAGASPIEDDDEEEDQHVARSAAEASILTPESHIAQFPGFQPDRRARESMLSEGRPIIPLSDGTLQKTHNGRILRLPNNVWRLIDVYFAYTHPWLPIVEKEYVLRLSYSYPPDGLEINPGSAGSGDHAQLWSILAIAATHEAALGRREATEGLHFSSKELYDVSRRLIPDDRVILEVGHISALLLLSLVESGSQAFSAAWMLIGRATRGALLLDYQVSSSASEGQPLSNRSKPVFLACFVLDTLLSSQLGKMPYIKREYAQAIGPLKEEGLDEWQPWTGCEGFSDSTSGGAQVFTRRRSPMLSISIFNQLVELCCILNGVSMREDRVPLTEPEHHLLRWFAKLPPELHTAGQLEEAATPQRLNLILAYWYVRVLCNRSPLNPDPLKEARSAFEQYARTIGYAAMVPLFSSFIKVFQDSAAGSLKPYFYNLDVQIQEVWTGRVERMDVPSEDRTPEAIIVQSTSLQATPRPFVQSPAKQSTTQTIPIGQSVDFVSYPPPENIVPQLDTFYGGNYLERYNSSGSMDLDALFDDLASLDGAERGDAQPQFMQNLGFAPTTNLADFLNSDYGQLDHLLNVYGEPGMNGGLAYNTG